MDTYWLAFYRFGSNLVFQKQDLLRRLEIMERISASCGFWYPHDGICIVSDRFLEVKWDNARNRHGMPTRLHSEDGPAVKFRDTWSLYYWHGFRIPITHEWIIADRNKVTKETILAEPNTELRRIMCEVVGWPKAIELLGGKTVASDELHGQPRQLVDVRIGTGEKVRLIKIVNGTVEADGTRHEFIEGVPLTVKTPHDAEAWAYGIAPKHYREAVRT
jgi:hypothetical protein